MNTFFYDKQIRRYLIQFMRTFSFLRYQTGPNSDGIFTEHEVPIIYGDMQRQAAQILNKNSENSILPGVIMSYYIVDLKPAPERRKHQTHTSTVSVVEQRHTEDGYDRSGKGNKIDVERHMTAPYNLTIQLDISTNTTTTKMQIIEQILMVFNPDVVIQQNSNMLDWSNITSIRLDDIVWTNRSIGNQIDEEREYASLTFNVPIEISPPAKVTRSRLIEDIVLSLDVTKEISEEEMSKFYDPAAGVMEFEERKTQIVRAEDYYIKIGVDGLHDMQAGLFDREGKPVNWKESFYQTGLESFLVVNVASFPTNKQGDIYFKFTEMPSNSYIIGIELDETTLPTNTLPNVDRLVNPNKTEPGNGLPDPAEGQRYILTSDLTQHSENWLFDCHTLPEADDIIEFKDGRWVIVFNRKIAEDRANEDMTDFVYVSSSNKHLKYDKINGWVYTYLNEYGPERWKILIK